MLPDERTPGQRRHDALAEVLDAVLRTDGLPATGGTPTKIDEQMGTSSSKIAGDRRKKQPAAATGMTASAAVAAGEHRHQLFATV